MDFSDNTVDRLKRSIFQLVERSRSLAVEKRKLETQVLGQEEELKTARNKIEQLESQLNQVLLKESLLEVTGGVKAAKQRVNTLLRDIDRCIAMMNK